MQTVVVASTNPVKIRATELGFQRMFPGQVCQVVGVSVPSGVSDQPMDDEETLRGAHNRANHARAARPDATWWVGLEGGVDEKAGELEAFAWIVVLRGDQVARSRTATFTLPPQVASLVRAGVELAHADDQVFGRQNSKHTNGAVGLLTGDVIDRTAYYEHAVVLALIPFRNAELFG
ncbi:MAG: inosine/xanthosine triphosphatase [Myxococcota bacterium]